MEVQRFQNNFYRKAVYGLEISFQNVFSRIGISLSLMLERLCLSKIIDPELGFSMADMSFSRSVVFPAPDGPVTNTSSPSEISKLIFCKYFWTILDNSYILFRKAIIQSSPLHIPLH